MLRHLALLSTLALALLALPLASCAAAQSCTCTCPCPPGDGDGDGDGGPAGDGDGDGPPAGNAVPIGAADVFSTPADTAILIPHAAMLANDYDADGDALQFLLADDVANGTISFSADGVTFAPATGFVGDGSFYYALTDGYDGGDWGLVAYAVVTIHVGDTAPVPDAGTGEEPDAGTVDPDPDPTPDAGTPAPSTARRAMFWGHSLVNHRPVDHNVPDWVHRLSGGTFVADGEFGGLQTSAANLPVGGGSFFTLDETPSAWGGSFAASYYDAAVITAINFIQGSLQSGPTLPTAHYFDNGVDTGFSPVDHAITVLDYARAQEPGIELYLYAHWPEFVLAGIGYPASAAEMATYQAYTRGAFFGWWEALQDEIRVARPDLDVRLIPAGYVIAGLFAEFSALAAIPSAELYEDADPHGEPTMYFLAGLVHYMVLYGAPPPSDYVVPAVVHAAVRDNYAAIAAYAWADLATVTRADGTSRVFE